VLPSEQVPPQAAFGPQVRPRGLNNIGLLVNISDHAITAPHASALIMVGAQCIRRASRSRSHGSRAAACNGSGLRRGDVRCPAAALP